MVSRHNNMGERIEQAKKQAEVDFRNKVERSRLSDVDMQDFLTGEELDRMLSDNEFFNGRVADLSKIQRHKKLAQAAAWLNDNCGVWQ
jgi:hypothetical protein